VESHHVHRFLVSIRLLAGGEAHIQTHHRLLQVNTYNNSMGMGNVTALKEYLRGKTVEEAFPYMSSKNECKYKHNVIRKEWTEVEFAKICNVDHLIARKEIWMNGLLFTMACSHCLNSSMLHVCSTAGSWCFALGHQEYTGGK
jgi:hypothetical protein